MAELIVGEVAGVDGLRVRYLVVAEELARVS